MITLEPGDLLIEKDGSFAILLKRDDSLGVGAWKVIWNDGKTDMLPWVDIFDVIIVSALVCLIIYTLTILGIKYENFNIIDCFFNSFSNCANK